MSTNIRWIRARVTDMVSIRELLINVVKHDKPKMLTGLNQNGTGSAQEVLFLLTWTQ